MPDQDPKTQLAHIQFRVDSGESPLCLATRKIIRTSHEVARAAVLPVVDGLCQRTARSFDIDPEHLKQYIVYLMKERLGSLDSQFRDHFKFFNLETFFVLNEDKLKQIFNKSPEQMHILKEAVSSFTIEMTDLSRETSRKAIDQLIDIVSKEYKLTRIWLDTELKALLGSSYRLQLVYTHTGSYK
jgi:hypothetical protein